VAIRAIPAVLCGPCFDDVLQDIAQSSLTPGVHPPDSARHAGALAEAAVRTRAASQDLLPAQVSAGSISQSHVINWANEAL
jgi:hypothetical protein